MNGDIPALNSIDVDLVREAFPAAAHHRGWFGAG